MKKFFINLSTSFMDIINAFKFKRQMKYLEISEDEEFKKLNLHTNWLGNVVYTQINFTEKDLMNVDYSVYDLAMEGIKPYVEYFDKNGWSEYLVPQISNIEDENGEMTLSYMYLFIYMPKVFTFWKMIKFLSFITILIFTIYYGIKWYIGMYI